MVVEFWLKIGELMEEKLYKIAAGYWRMKEEPVRYMYPLSFVNPWSIIDRPRINKGPWIFYYQ